MKPYFKEWFCGHAFEECVSSVDLRSETNIQYLCQKSRTLNKVCVMIHFYCAAKFDSVSSHTSPYSREFLVIGLDQLYQDTSAAHCWPRCVLSVTLCLHFICIVIFVCFFVCCIKDHILLCYDLYCPAYI